ncbi:MAG: RNA-binding protein [Hyphomicrobium sp.]|nr:RNA-binding protein [Hyphomicrobium sp.]
MSALGGEPGAFESPEPELDTGPDAGPVRLCVASRKERPVDELLRFVLSPGGEIVPDLAHKLPGRGVWVSCERSAVLEAVKKKAFARSLRRDVRAPDDLADRVESLLDNRVREALSIANKAGRVTSGFEKIDALIGKGEARVLLHAREAAADGTAKLDRKFMAVAASQGRPATIISIMSVEQMSLAIGRANVVHAALTQGGATERFLTEAGRRERYRPLGAGDALVADQPAADEKSRPG